MWILFYCSAVEYDKGEDPHLLSSAKYNYAGRPSRVAMSPNGEVVVVASKSSLAFYSVQTGECDAVIDNIYAGKTAGILPVYQVWGFLMTLFYLCQQ